MSLILQLVEKSAEQWRAATISQSSRRIYEPWPSNCVQIPFNCVEKGAERWQSATVLHSSRRFANNVLPGRDTFPTNGLLYACGGAARWRVSMAGPSRLLCNAFPLVIPAARDAL